MTYIICSYKDLNLARQRFPDKIVVPDPHCPDGRGYMLGSEWAHPSYRMAELIHRLMVFYVRDLP